jgi:hypothetical protein
VRRHKITFWRLTLRLALLKPDAFTSYIQLLAYYEHFEAFRDVVVQEVTDQLRSARIHEQSRVA